MMIYGGSTMAQEAMTGKNKLLWSQSDLKINKTKRKGDFYYDVRIIY